MKTKNEEKVALTNIFEIALHQEFRKLQLGEPDKKVRKTIDKACKKITAEVKRFMKEKQKLEAKRRKKELKKLREEGKKKLKGARTASKKTARPQSDLVEDIVA